MAREPQGDIAWSHVLGQHADKPKMEAFYRSFYGPLTAAASGLDALKTSTDMEVAQGDRLDLIGSIVGISRDIPDGITLAFFGFQSQASGRAFGVARMRRDGEPISQAYTAGDVEYRSLIRAKIGLNNGHGTAPEIVATLSRIYGGVPVSVRDAGNAEIDAWIARIPLPEEVTGDLIKRLLPRAAGVAINLFFYTPEFFGFFGQVGATGFDQAPMARAESSNINPF